MLGRALCVPCVQIGLDIASGLAHLHSAEDEEGADPQPSAEEESDRLLLQQQLSSVGAVGLALWAGADGQRDGQQAAAGGAGRKRLRVVHRGALNGRRVVKGGPCGALWSKSSQCDADVVHALCADLKPANILINSQGRAKISDFGLAREHANTTIHTGACEGCIEGVAAASCSARLTRSARHTGRMLTW